MRVYITTSLHLSVLLHVVSYATHFNTQTLQTPLRDTAKTWNFPDWQVSHEFGDH